MNKTVFITGCSAGIGKATAIYFQNKGWNVVATMRNLQDGEDLKRLNNLELIKLDVTDSSQIASAVNKALERFGRIDVLVNNAGYGLYGPFELATPEQIQEVFAVNVFGYMEVMRVILPHFRQNRSGTIVNVTSLGGRITYPNASCYVATKWAMEGFTENLYYELNQFGIKLKLVEPGPVQTDFTGRSLALGTKEIADYGRVNQKIRQTIGHGFWVDSPDLVAKIIFKAANDKSSRMRYMVGLSSLFYKIVRRLLPEVLYLKIVNSLMN